MNPALPAVSAAQTAVNIENLMQHSFCSYIVVAVVLVLVLVVVVKINKLFIVSFTEPFCMAAFFLNAGVTETLTQISPAHTPGVP